MKTRDLLEKLVSFDTTSRNSNLEFVNYVKEYLSKENIESRLTFSDDHTKANLFATINTNSNLENGLILSGHADVVPVDNQKWDTDPFKTTQIGNKIYGRGTSDMKGFVAVVLSLIPKFKELNAPLHFALSYDEEPGCVGAQRMIDDLAKANIKPKGCIVGEPSNMKPISAHKGKQLFSCKITGKAVHSSLVTNGCNAIEYGSEIVQWLKNTADEIRKTGPFDVHFDVPFTSISTNLMKGGAADNIIPADCEFVFEIRYLPGFDPDKNIIDRLKQNIEKYSSKKW